MQIVEEFRMNSLRQHTLSSNKLSYGCHLIIVFAVSFRVVVTHVRTRPESLVGCDLIDRATASFVALRARRGRPLAVTFRTLGPVSRAVCFKNWEYISTN